MAGSSSGRAASWRIPLAALVIVSLLCALALPALAAARQAAL